MPREILLASLTPGRCFRAPTEAEAAEAGDAAAFVVRTLLAPSEAWKVVQSSDDGVDAVSALGREVRFPPTLRVREIPRQGFERLKERASG